LLLSERYTNLPTEAAPWMHQALLSEVQWALEDEPTKEERQVCWRTTQRCAPLPASSVLFLCLIFVVVVVVVVVVVMFRVVVLVFRVLVVRLTPHPAGRASTSGITW
jgi:hypothetical protein